MRRLSCGRRPRLPADPAGCGDRTGERRACSSYDKDLASHLTVLLAACQSSMRLLLSAGLERVACDHIHDLHVAELTSGHADRDEILDGLEKALARAKAVDYKACALRRLAPTPLGRARLSSYGSLPPCPPRAELRLQVAIGMGRMRSPSAEDLMLADAALQKAQDVSKPGLLSLGCSPISRALPHPHRPCSSRASWQMCIKRV